MSNQKKYGVLIGCNMFLPESELEDLRCPPNDVAGLRRVLEDPKICGFDHVESIFNPLKHEAEELINSVLTKANYDDLVLIYYSGHGKTNIKFKLHLATSNTRAENLEATSIPIATIQNYIGASSASKIILILDCCYSGRVGEMFPKGGGIKEDMENTFRQEGKGIYVLTASTGIEVAMEKEEEEYSVFTGPLIKGLESAEADANNDGWVSATDLYNYVFREVKKSNQQTPTIIRSGEGEVFLIEGKSKKIQTGNLDKSKILKLSEGNDISNSLLFEVLEFLDGSMPDLDPQSHDYLINEVLRGNLNPKDFSLKWKANSKKLSKSQKTDSVKVLSLDATGVKTFAYALFLEEIEKRTNCPIHKLFDLISATSFGSILAICLTQPDQSGSERFSAKELSKQFSWWFSNIFRRPLHYKLKSMSGLLSSKYQGESLRDEVRKFTGDTLLSGSLTDLIIGSYELTRRTPFFFRSRLARQSKAHDFKLVDVGVSSSSLPTYFPPVEVMSQNGESFNLIDAASLLGNPTMAAFLEITKSHPNRSYEIVSLGIKNQVKGYFLEDSISWGMAEWVSPLLDITTQGVAETVNDQMNTVLSEDSYSRVEIDLGLSIAKDLDDVQVENVNNIKTSTDKFILENSEMIDSICEKLVR